MDCFFFIACGLSFSQWHLSKVYRELVSPRYCLIIINVGFIIVAVLFPVWREPELSHKTKNESYMQTMQCDSPSTQCNPQLFFLLLYEKLMLCLSLCLSHSVFDDACACETETWECLPDGHRVRKASDKWSRPFEQMTEHKS